MNPRRIVVIGAGLVGLGTARALRKRHPDAEITVLEKEAGVARHQSTHNSGVLHAGLYYAPGSLKARMAVEGIRAMKAYCAERKIAHETCGKVVVAVDSSELPRLEKLHERGTANGLSGLRKLGSAELKEREPHVSGVAGLLVPEEGIVDYGAVAASLQSDLEGAGAKFLFRSAPSKILREGAGWKLLGSTWELDADLLVSCGGLHSDRIARMAGAKTDVKIVPFRGEYYELSPEAKGLVKHLIYPVPDPAFPFLGVHFTRMIHGGAECGPNAVLATAREGYRLRDVNLRDLAESLAFPGLWRFLARNPSVVTSELARSLSKSLFLKSLQRLVPETRAEHMLPGMAGVRAQAMNGKGELLQDFAVHRMPGALHVLNAPSPGATSSLAIGEWIAEQASLTA